MTVEAESDVSPEETSASPAPLAPETPRSLSLDLEIDVDAQPNGRVAAALALRRKRTRQVGALAAVVWALAIAVFAVALTRSPHHARELTVAATAPPTPAPPPVRTHDAPPAAPPRIATTEAPPVDSASAKRGHITLPSYTPGHRVWFDGHLVTEEETIETRCGWHSVRVGSHGGLQWLDVPCGGSIAAK